MEQKEEFTGEKLRELRKKFNMTQAELSQGTAIPRPNISAYENGAKMSKSISILFRLFFEKKARKF